MTSTDAERDGTRLGAFLRERRQRLDPSLRSLGEHLRLPARRGRPVTQEELAEAAGVSRVWYAMLESGAKVRTSAKILDRLSIVLMLEQQERAELFQRAIPEFRRIELRPESAEVLESFTIVRTATKRLWSATSEIEALETVAEEISGIVEDADLVFYVRRLGEGAWEWPYVVDHGWGRPNREAFEDVASAMTPAEIDEFVFFPQLTEPGASGTPEAFASRAVRAAYEDVFCAPSLDLGSLLHVRVRSRSGLIAGFTVKHRGRHTYPAEQRAMMSTLADLTSIALS